MILLRTYNKYYARNKYPKSTLVAWPRHGIAVIDDDAELVEFLFNNVGTHVLTFKSRYTSKEYHYLLLKEVPNDMKLFDDIMQGRSI